MAILIPKILIFLSTLAIHLTSAQILAIDFGTEFIKAAVVNKGSGKAFSIVETPRSERKFVNSVSIWVYVDWVLCGGEVLLGGFIAEKDTVSQELLHLQ